MIDLLTPYHILSSQNILKIICYYLYLHIFILNIKIVIVNSIVLCITNLIRSSISKTLENVYIYNSVNLCVYSCMMHIPMCIQDSEVICAKTAST